MLLGATPDFLARGARLERLGEKMAAPKSGQVQGGNAQKGRRLHSANRNTALQQHAEIGNCPQAPICNHSRQNAAETL
jgi:hypothetical protein